MNNLTSIVTVFFILSTICERVAEFLKQFLSEKKIGKWEIIGNTVTKFAPESREENRRQYRILKLNIICGFITALLCHASLFDIIRNIKDPGMGIGWPEGSLPKLTFTSTDIFNHVAFLLGCLLTGAFISLGSKFWHDLLDILVEAKNAKRAVNELNNMPNFDALNREEQHALIAEAISVNKEAWKNNISNYQGVSVANKLTGSGQTDTGILSIRFNLTEKKDLPDGALNKVPSVVFYKGYKIPTDVTGSGSVNATAAIQPGASIGREQIRIAGTLGLRIKTKEDGREKFWGVSCYHVLFPEELKKSRFIISSTNDPAILSGKNIFTPSALDAAPQNGIGVVARGVFNRFLDIAFFETTEQRTADAVLEFGKPQAMYHIRKADEGTLKVKMFGRSSREQHGVVTSAKSDQVVNYFTGTDAFSHNLEDLIQVRMTVKHGDSGAALLTEDNRVAGIIVAADNTHGYAIPIRFLDNNFTILDI